MPVPIRCLYGVIGLGNVGQSLLVGASRRNVLSSFIGTDVDFAKAKLFKSQNKVLISKHTSSVINSSQIVILTLRPEDVEKECYEISKFLRKDQVVLSLVDGIPMSTLHEWLKSDSVPNVPIVKGFTTLSSKPFSGMSAICPNQYVEKKNYRYLRDIFSTKNIIIVNDEKKLNVGSFLSAATTIFSSSLVEEISRVGNAAGLTPEETSMIIHSSLYDSLALQEEKTPSDIRNNIVNSCQPIHKNISSLYALRFPQIFYDEMMKSVIDSFHLEDSYRK